MLFLKIEVVKMNRIINLSEFETRDVKLTRRTAVELSEGFYKKYINIYPKIGFEDTYTIIAKNYIGSIVCDDCIINIKPKTNILCIFEMIDYVYNLAIFNDKETYFKDYDDIFDFLVSIFADKTIELLLKGIYKNYISQCDNLSFVKGRVTVQQNIRINHTYKNRFFCEFDEFTIDIPENKIIKYVIYILMKREYKNKHIKGKLKTIYTILNDVSLETIKPDDIDKIIYNRLNMSYKPILTYCKMFLYSISIRNEIGTKRSAAYLIDMNKLFESFITKKIKEEFKSDKEITVKSQSPSYIDDNKNICIKPDIRILKNNKDVLIIDTKYKIFEEDEIKYGDIYQMITYCTTFATNRGILLYAQGQDKSYRIKNTSITIESAIVDFGGEREAFLERCREMVDWVRELCCFYRV